MAFTLNAMSIYGQDTRMLEKIYYSQEDSSTATLSTLPEYKPPSRCLFLTLPLELRQQIYRYALPGTYNHQSKGVVWLRGGTALLATNSQIHDEASSFIYSMNTFLIDVCYDCSTFDYRWSLLNGLFPRRRLAFPEQFGDRYIALLRNIQISIYVIDPYTGMTKFNYGGSGLMEGLKQQVQFLCQSLSRISEIRHLDIVLRNTTYTPRSSHQVLEPFLNLKNVRQGTFMGDVEPSFKKILCKHLNGTRKVISLSDLPYEIRHHIYRWLLPESASCKCEIEDWSRHGTPQALSGIIALSSTNHKFYTEVQAFIFHNLRNLKLSIYQDLTYRFSLPHHSPLRTRRSRSLPISSFQTSMFKPALSHLRGLHISFSYIPLDVHSPRYKSLESFIEALVLTIQSAPLTRLKVDYVASRQRSSSGDSPKTNIQPFSSPTSFPRFFDLESTNAQEFHQNLSLDRAAEQSMAESRSRLTNIPIEASPTSATFTGSQSPSLTLQTSPILFLVTKLNPLMTQVKARANGQVTISRHSQRNSSMEEADEYLVARKEPISTRRINQVNFDEITDTFGSPSRRARRSASPQSGGSTESRSSSVKRRSRALQLFTDVPL